MDWSELYPAYFQQNDTNTTGDKQRQVEFADVGCGYGGLLGVLFLSITFMHAGK